MATTGTVTINIVGDADRFKRALGDAESTASSFGTRMRKIGDIAAGVFGGALLDRAAVKVVDFFQGAFAEAQESIKVTNETARVIESMGGVANVTATQVEKLSTAISNKVGIDDEAIQSGANLLLTFGNIRNEVGKGNDVFNQATKLAVDMSTVFKQDLKSSAVQLGKALNDPIAGLTSLSRIGVQFNEQQKEQIKVLIEAGDTLGAQKIILAEVGRQVGGAAAAAATPFEKLQVRFKNLQEEIGLKLMPVLVRLAEWFNTEGLPALERFIDWIEENWPKWSKAVQDVWNVIGPIYKAMIRQITAFIDLIDDLIHGRWSEIWGDVVAIFRAAWDLVWAQFRAGILVLVAVFKDLPGQIVNALEALPGLLLDLAVLAMNAFWDGIKYVAGQILDFAEKLPSRLIDAAVALIELERDLGLRAMEAFWNGIKWFAEQAVAYVAQLPDRILGALRGIAERLYEKGRNAGAAFLKGLKDGAGSVFGGLLDLSNPLDEIGGLIPGVDVPLLADGGVVKRPTLAVIGESGPEAVVPLHKMGAMGGPMIGTVNIVAPDPESAADKLVRRLRTEAFLAGM